MENNKQPSTEVSLISSRLVECQADVINRTQPEKGGTVQFVITVETPETPDVLKSGDTFTIGILLECKGKNRESKKNDFSIACKMEGKYKVFKCQDCGIITENNHVLWTYSAGMLFPLLAQYVSDTASRMGYKNINVPMFLPATHNMTLEEPLKKKAKIPIKPTTKRIKTT